MREQITKSRLARMLAEDKEDMNPETEDAAIRDFQRVADEYFETEGKVRLSVKKEGGSIAVALSFRAVRVKNFSKLK